MGPLRRARPRIRPWLVAIVVAIAVTAVAAAGVAGDVFSAFQRHSLDRLFPAGAADPRIVVVGIDRASIETEGHPWPWPRSDQARLIAGLEQQGASLIVYDALLSAPGEGDDRLSDAIRSGNVVLAEAATFGEPTDDGLYRAERVEEPVPELAQSAAGLGHANLLTDPDGAVRSLPLIVEDPDRALVPSVVLEASALLAGESPVPTIRPDGVQVGSSFIPTDSRAALSISYASQLDPIDSAASYVSAADVLSGHTDSSLRGAVVLVGVIDPAAGDIHATPVGPTMPGVFVLANALNTILTRSFIAPANRVSTLAWVGILALLVALIVQLLPPWAAAAGWIGLAGGYLILAFFRFDQGVTMDLVYPPLAATVAFVGSLGERTLAEIRGRRRVSSLFAQYVPPAVARRLVEEPALVAAALRGERFDSTLLFCDLRGFTALAGSITPQQVRDMLEIFYEHTSRIVGEHRGTVIQYVGDEIYAAFGVPAPTPDHAMQAVACGIAFQRAAPAINDGLAEIGIPPIHYGVGIESGPVVAALVGNERRRQYSVNGDAVNVAARLCAGAPAGEIWITGDVVRQLDTALQTDDLGILPFKNVNREVRVYRVRLDLPDPSV